MTDKATMENLQKGLQMELTATHQYQLHAHVLDDWGLDILATQMRKEMQEELAHADAFINRIMFLDGKPKLDFHKKPVQAATLTEMLQADLDDEAGAIVFYTEAAMQAAKAGDVGSRTLFERILLEEEGHKAWLDLQLSLLDRLGEKAYAAKYVSGAAPAEA